MSAITPAPEAELPATLSAELVALLGVLDGAPPGLAEATIALLPFGSRLSLAAHDYIQPMDGGREDAVTIEITTAGWAAIRTCARARASRADRDGAPCDNDRRGPLRVLEDFVASLQRQLPSPSLGQLSARLNRD